MREALHTLEGERIALKRSPCIFREDPLLMIALLLLTLSMGILDSFNPVALTQQFFLQGMVKKRQHTLYFIGAVGVTNLIGGLFIYYGLDMVLQNFWILITERYPWCILICELLLGIAALFYVWFKKSSLLEPDSREKGVEVSSRVKSVSLPALIGLGMVSVLCEIPTAVPYFGWLALLIGYNLSFPAVLLLMAVYNLLFVLPLLVMHILYIRCQKKVEKLYRFLCDKVFRYGDIVLPLLLCALGITLISHAAYQIVLGL